jgi:hypothetical protein
MAHWPAYVGGYVAVTVLNSMFWSYRVGKSVGQGQKFNADEDGWMVLGLSALASGVACVCYRRTSSWCV